MPITTTPRPCSGFQARGHGVGRAKRGAICGPPDPQDALNQLAQDVADLAATQARALVGAAAALARRGEGGVLEAIERAAQQGAARIGLAAVAGVIDWAGQQTPPHPSCPNASCPGGGHRVRLVARRSKTLRTLLGAVHTTRGYYHCAACHAGFAPLDDQLGVAGTSLSPGLARAAALAGAEMPYARSFELIATVSGLDLASISTLARTTRREGTRAREVISAEHTIAMTTPRPVSAPTPGGPDKCYIVMDGTGAPMLPSETHGRTGKNKPRAGTREVKIACLFTQTHTNPDTGEPLQDEGSTSYVSTFQPAAGFAVQTKAEYLRRGFERIRQPIVLGDGAKWIWTIADQHFPAATQIVDYFHAREHIADLTKYLTPVLPDPQGFEQHLVDALDLGHTHTIAQAVTALDLDTTAPDLLKHATTEVGYFTTNHHRMQYADFKANSYHIGSGPVEAACNTIVKQRAKRAGMHWTIKGLDPILAIRTLHQSHRDHTLWPEQTTTPQT